MIRSRTVINSPRVGWLGGTLAMLGALAGSSAAQAPVPSRRPVASPPPVAPPLPMAVTNNAVAVLTLGPGAGLYSFLGVDSSKRWSGITRRAFHQPAGAKAWQELPPVPGAVGRLAALTFGVRGKVYLIGGYTVDSAGAERSLANVDSWDPVQRTWSAGAPTPVAVDDAVGGVWRDSLIVLVTGWHDTDNVAEVQLYDPAANRWTRGTPFAGTPVFGGGGTVAGNQVLVFGGARRASGPVKYTMAPQAWLGTMDSLDPAKITWESLPPMPGPARYRAGAIACGSRIIVAGGTDNPYNYNGIGYDGKPSAPIADAVAFDLRTRRWISESAPPMPVMDLRAIVAQRGRAWVVGGMRAGQRVAADAVSWPLSRCGARPLLPPAAAAANAPPPAVVARPLAASSLTWNQAEREAGFSVMDTLFPNRVIRRGPRVSPLPAGAPLAAFAPGGALAAMLDQYMAEQETAGIIIVHDGARGRRRPRRPHQEHRRSRDALHHADEGERLRRRHHPAVADDDIGSEVERGLHRPQV